MDRYVIKEPRHKGEHPEGNQMIAFSATSSTGNNITMPENVYYGVYDGEVQNANVQQLGTHRLVTPHVQTYSPNVIPAQGQVSSIDRRYSATYAENNATFYADMNAAHPGNNATYPKNNAAYPNNNAAYPNNNAAYPDSNAAYPNNNAAYAQTMQTCNKLSTAMVNTFGSDYQNRNFIGAETNNPNFYKTQANMNNSFNRVQSNNHNLNTGQVNNTIRAQVNNLNFPGTNINNRNFNKMQTNNHSFNRGEANNNFNRAPIKNQNFKGAKENIQNFKGVPDNNQNVREAVAKNQHFKGAESFEHKLYVPQTTSSVASKKQTEVDLLKHELQNQVKTRADKLKELQKSGTRIYSGPVEKILKWHKSIQEIGVMVLYEIVGKCVNVRAGESCAKNLVVRDENGPAIQVVYYEIDFFLPELKPPCTVRVIGRMMPGTNRFQAFNVRPATGDDVATLPRRAAVAAHHVAKLTKEYGIEVLTLK